MFSNCVDEILRFIFILKTLFRQFHILPVIDLKNLFPLCTVVRLCCYELWSNAEERLSIINSYSQRKCHKFSITLNPFIWNMSFINSYFFLFSFFFFFWLNFINFSLREKHLQRKWTVWCYKLRMLGRQGKPEKQVVVTCTKIAPTIHKCDFFNNVKTLVTARSYVHHGEECCVLPVVGNKTSS